FQAFDVDDTAVSCSANLQLKNVKETEKPAESLRIDGSVYNGGDTPIDNISINVAVYRTDGRYAGEFSDYVQASVPAGKSAQFHAFGTRGSFPGVDVKPISADFTYRLFVSHLPGGFGYFMC
ncbi:MAG: FxLYD domain-containing protein, partial [Thermomicrobiales bacterium]